MTPPRRQLGPLRSFALLLAFAGTAQAGLAPGAVTSALLAAQQAAAAAAAALSAYESARYPGEHGPYASSSCQVAVRDALGAVNNTAYGIPNPFIQTITHYGNEVGSIVYRDRYGYCWWLTPWPGMQIQGQPGGPGVWSTDSGFARIQRPGSTPIDTIHSHVFPTYETLQSPNPRLPPSLQDNTNNIPAYVIIPNASLLDGTFSGHATVWFYRPSAKRAQTYGTFDDNSDPLTISSTYGLGTDPLNTPDPYAVSPPMTPPAPNDPCAGLTSLFWGLCESSLHPCLQTDTPDGTNMCSDGGSGAPMGGSGGGFLPTLPPPPTPGDSE